MSATRDTSARTEARENLVRGFALAFILAASRTGLFALKDAYFASGLFAMGAFSSARYLIAGMLVCYLVLGPVALVGGRSGLALRVPLGVLVGVLSYCFLSFQVPEHAGYVPEHYTALGRSVITATALIGLLTGTAIVWRGGARVLKAIAVGAVFVTVAALVLRIIPTSTAKANERPNLILISLDTLRADHLGCYGYEAPTSPEIDAFAKQALLFRNAYSPQPWTLTAHMSMLTGLYPSAHGVDRDRVLGPRLDTIASVLQKADYSTFAVVEHKGWLKPRYGFGRGFDYFARMPIDAATKVDRILALLDDRTGDPFFLFAHFFDAHSDWMHLPYDADSRDMDSFSGWYQGEFDGVGPEGLSASRHLKQLRADKQMLEDDDLRFVRSLYDAGIRSLDRQLGRLFDGLERRGLLVNSLIVVTADHGEEFFEHGEPLHGQNYQECLNIPLLIRSPSGIHGADSDMLVSLVDIAPTLYEYARIPQPDGLQGMGLKTLIEQGEETSNRTYVLFDDGQGAVGLRKGNWSLVAHSDKVELYDMSQDPGQTNNLLNDEVSTPAVRELLELRRLWADRFEGFRQAHAATDPSAALSDEERSELDALGYMGDGG